MARQATMVGEAKPTLKNRVVEFYHEVMSEMSKVTWPTQEELKNSTQVVLGLLVLSAAVTFLYDKVFNLAVYGLFWLVD